MTSEWFGWNLRIAAKVECTMNWSSFHGVIGVDPGRYAGALERVAGGVF